MPWPLGRGILRAADRAGCRRRISTNFLRNRCAARVAATACSRPWRQGGSKRRNRYAAERIRRGTNAPHGGGRPPSLSRLGGWFNGAERIRRGTNAPLGRRPPSRRSRGSGVGSTGGTDAPRNRSAVEWMRRTGGRRPHPALPHRFATREGSRRGTDAPRREGGLKRRNRSAAEQIRRASAQAAFRAWSRSARMSSICSMPIESRT